ncbi:TrlF family AAA-like ATPase [Vibrio splendidus]
MSLGSKWYKFDFHTHTPESEDYRDSRDITPEQWLKAAMAREVDCIAITDHNSGRWVDALKSAYSELDTSVDWYRPLNIFPGVEITLANGGNRIHLLAIFDPNVNQDTITAVLGGCGITSGFGDPDTTSSYKSISDVITVVNDAGGIAIPAHADGAKGLLENTTTCTPDLKSILNDIIAIQYLDKDHRTSTSLDIELQRALSNVAVVRGSDAHKLDDIGKDGGCTWVKLGAIGIESLRLSLQDSEFSVLNQSSNPNSLPNAYINDITIQGMAHCGARGVPPKIELHPHFNTIIGGRGTGKSTVIESMRLALSREHEPQENDLKSIAAEIESFHKDVVKPETRVSLSFTRNQTKYKSEWYQGTVSSVEKLDENGAWNNDGNNIRERFPVNIYSQKQIHAFATNTTGLLEIVDRDTDVNANEWNTKFQELKSSYDEVCLSIRTINTKLENELEINSKLKDLNTDISRFEKSGVASVFEDYRNALTIDRALKEHTDTTPLTVLLDEIGQLSFDQLGLPETTDPFTQDHITEVQSFHTSYLEEIQKVLSSVVTLKTDLITAKQKYEENIQKSSWNTKNQQVIDSYNAILASTEDTADANAVTTPEQYKGWVAERDKHLVSIQKFEELKEELIELQEQKSKLIEDAIELREELHRNRQRFLDQVLDGNQYVKMTLKPYINKSHLEEKFRNLLGIDAEKFSSAIFDSEGHTGLLCAMMDIDLSKSTPDIKALAIEELNKIKDEVITIAQGGTSSVSGVNGHFKNYIKKKAKESPTFLDEIEFWLPDDFLDVRFAINMGQGSTPRFTSITKGSAGQKSAAILAFLLSHGEAPIIVDQPEDDLDNALIYNLIVKQIHENRTRRQIIMVTHNPNIVVNGDADLVNVLHFSGGQVSLKVGGGLSLEEVRKEVCDIMEGGQEALRKRYKRISSGDTI